MTVEQEDIHSLSLKTGRANSVGRFNDLYWVSRGLGVIDEGNALYQPGDLEEDENNTMILFVKDYKGEKSIPLDHRFDTVHINSRGELIGLDVKWITLQLHSGGSGNNELYDLSRNELDLSSVIEEVPSGESQLRLINTTTGESTLISILPDLESIPYTKPRVIDNENDQLIYLGRMKDDEDFSLLVIDSLSGEILSKSTLDRYYSSLHINKVGALVGLTWNDLKSVEELREIDRFTGYSKLVSTIPQIHLILGGVNGFNPLTGDIYIHGVADGSGDPILFVIDSSTGELVGNVPMINSYTFFYVDYKLGSD